MFNYSTDLQGSQTILSKKSDFIQFNYSTDLQGSQTLFHYSNIYFLFNYSTDLQGSQTSKFHFSSFFCLTTLLIYKVLKLGVQWIYSANV